MRHWRALDLSYCLGLGAVAFAAIFLTGWLAHLLPMRLHCTLAGSCNDPLPPGLSWFFVWDAGYYDDVARLGYQWAPHRNIQTTIAFFPLWPLILRALHSLFAPLIGFRAATLGLCAAIGLASIAAFHQLARAVLDLATARRATLLYLCFPASHFLLQSYPTGVLNLLICLSLLALLRAQFLHAALWAGIAAGAGPIAVSVSATVSVCALIARTKPLLDARTTAQRAKILAGLAAIGALSLAGLLAFMAYQYWQFGTPLAFIDAQNAWGTSPPLLPRIARWGLIETILPALLSGAALTIASFHSLAAIPAFLKWEAGINSLGLALGMVAIWGCWRLKSWPLLFQGWLAIALYAWFIGTAQGPNYATLRLIYLAPAIFIGLAAATQKQPILFYVFALLFTLVLITLTVLSGMEYRVI